MKKFTFKNKSLSIIVVFAFSYYTSAAQAKVIVNGAKINLAKSAFISTTDVSLLSGSTVIVDSSTIKIAGTMASAGVFDVTKGTIETNGTSSQVIPANVFYNNVIRNLTVNNTANVALQGTLDLTEVLSLSSGSLASNGNLTLKSTYALTARVAPVTSVASVPISGDVTVERFIPAKRAYRLLTAPLTSSTGIRANWMENTNNTTTGVNNNPLPGFGTHITGGSSGGFDVTVTNSPSMYAFNTGTQQFTSVPNTNVLYTPGAGYRIIVRGSRSTDLNNNASTPTPTTLRAKGSLVTGTLVLTKSGGGGTAGMPPLSPVLNAYTLVGNPYASVLDWNTIEKTDISTTISIFDPTVNGSNGRGGYVSYNGTFQTGSNGSNVDNNLQSGQAFFVQTIGANPSLTIKEIHKASANRFVFRTENTLPKLSVQLQLPSQINTPDAADGCLTFFSPLYSSGVSDEDSPKFANQDENIALLVQGKLLSIQGRQLVTDLDTVALKVWQLTKTNYSLRISLQNFDPSIQAFLHDRYQNVTTAISPVEVTNIPFSVNADTASVSANRFEVIFKLSSTLPLQFLSVVAYKKDKGIQVDWTTETESNMDRYIVEKSSNSQLFIAVDSVKAKQNAGSSSHYSSFDANPFTNNNYYRIKSIDKAGIVKYSRIVQVNISTENTIVLTDNPVRNQLIHFEIRNLIKDSYTVSIINAAGQVVQKSQLKYNGGVTNETLKINKTIPAGIYQLHFAGTNTEQNISMLIE